MTARYGDDWRRQAACFRKKGFQCLRPIPEQKHVPGRLQASIDVERAIYSVELKVCATCPVQEPCLAEALASPAKYTQGVGGGTTDSERQRIRNQKKRGRRNVA